MIAKATLAIAVLTSTLWSQELHLVEAVMQQAVDRVAPSVVTVRTFGGSRQTPKAGPLARQQDGKKKEEKDPKKDAEPKPRKPRRLRGPMGMQGFLQAQGATTGLVYKSDGWILVSRFALSMNPTTILVTLPSGLSYHATRQGEDSSRGIALLKIDATDLPVPEFRSPKTVQVGEWAFALGRTFGRKNPSVHLGVVSAVQRINGRAVQVDANTSPANYGGPIIDIQGRVFGLAVPMAASGREANVGLYDSGIGFAASIADIEPLLDRMQAGEALHRGWLGIATSPGHLGPGAEALAIVEASPAHQAGLRKGDTVLAVDGIKLRNTFHLKILIGAKMAGDTVQLKFHKPGEEAVIKEAKLAEAPGEKVEPEPADGNFDQLPWEVPGRER